jgi:ATP-dependent Clp protease ATP-binding subunit ClpC
MLLNGRYKIEKEIGRGGFAVVYLASDQQLLSKPVVIKILLDESLQNEWVLQKFKQEKEALVRLRHPGVVGVLDADETEDGKPYLVIEYVEGVNLRSVLKPEGLPLERIANIIRQVGAALDAAHEKGILHRDVKPENIMLQATNDGEEQIKLIDFGIAKIKDSVVAPSTVTAMTVGTISYMAPEQLNAEPVSAASDIYALGVIAYEMITGRRPFNPGSIFQLLKMQREGVKVMPRDLRPVLPEAAEAVLLKALAFEQHLRYQRARDFGQQLAEALILTQVRVSATRGKARSKPGDENADKKRAKGQPSKPAKTRAAHGPHNKTQAGAKQPKQARARASSKHAERSHETPSEVAHILFMDIVGFSKQLDDDQVQMALQLHRLVCRTAEFRRLSKTSELISLDTGDGMALAFFREHEAPVRCAVEVALALRSHPEIKLRMGVNSGPVMRRRSELTGLINLSGTGINMAQRVMDSGDAGHILVSQTVAGFLSQSRQWVESLHDLGPVKVKNDEIVYLFNLYADEYGNPELPKKLREARGTPVAARPSEFPANADEEWEREGSFEELVLDPALRQSGQSILIQTLGVSYYRNDAGREGLTYAPAPLGEMAQDSVFMPIKESTLERHLGAVRDCVWELTRLAVQGLGRGEHRVESVATPLACHVLPARGFAGMLGAGINPQFDMVQDAAAEIPWEILEECYLTCAACHKSTLPHRPSDTNQRYCERCGEKMERAGGKLALTLHLTHLVRGVGRAVGEGKQFLFIEDPVGDLCRPERDPAGACANHLLELRSIVERMGYDLKLLKNGHATLRRVLASIADPALVGIYYFGHGFFPRGGDEGRLVLADGVLPASHVKELAPMAKFVFLNACEGAPTGQNWGLEKRSQSMAKSFARGGRGKVVIAPLWPMAPAQAAEAALDFFHYASSMSPLGEALKVVRRNSLARYEAGEPHLSWMAYRYFGDPNKTLPIPAQAPITLSGGGAALPPPNRLFDSSGRLDTEVFAFAIEDVLLYAANRRNRQERAHVIVSDFLAGLLRGGDLTRFLLHEHGVSLEKVYEKILEQVEEGAKAVVKQKAEAGPPGDARADSPPGAADDGAAVYDSGNTDEEQLREFISKWIVRDREEFDNDLDKLLEGADRLAQERFAESVDRRITEQVVLESLIVNKEWAKHVGDAGLPPAATMRQLLRECKERGEVDENGCILLKDLDAQAKRIIENAHVLSQQRGLFPIPNRLLFAAFLAEEKGCAATACQRAGVPPDLLLRLMIASTEEESPEEHSPLSFGLSVEACERIVLPVIEEVRKNIAPDPRPIAEPDLFAAFRQMAAPEFKHWLNRPPLAIDLDKLGTEELPSDEPGEPDVSLPTPEDILDKRARRIVENAHGLAQKCGVFPVSNRLMLAAFLLDRDGPAARLLKRNNVPADILCNQLIKVSIGGPPRLFDLSDEACERIITPMIERAKKLISDSGVITAETLMKAFCEVATPELKTALKHQPWNLDLETLCVETQEDGDDVELAVKAGQGFDRNQFDDGVWRVLVESAQLARWQGWTEVRSPHLFAAMIGDGTGAIGEALKRNGIEPDEIKKNVLALVPTRKQPADAPPPTLSLRENARLIVLSAIKRAVSEGRERATEEDLVAAFQTDSDGGIIQVLGQHGMELSLRVYIQRRGHNGTHRMSPSNAQPKAQPVEASSESTVLSVLGVDLTEKAKKNQLPVVVGRDAEIETAMQTLLLTDNANPLLVGDAGVGKTAIVEGLAQRIAQGNCPQKLQSMRVIELGAGALLASKRYRGDFEQRIQEVLSAARENVILFIDEIQMLVGAGASEASGPDAGNMLKTALARSQIRLIGAITPHDHKRTIARDEALSRRFQVQIISPLSREATIQMLAARQSALEQQYGVRVTEEAIAAVVDLSGRYITSKQWPAKARDVFERACCIAATEAEVLQTKAPVTVTVEHVTKVIATQTGVPVERISASGLSALSTLEDRLAAHIVGQRHIIQAVADSIRKGRQGLAHAQKPWGVFLLVGDPGVGKTAFSKALAAEVYGEEGRLIRVDMGDFTEAHSVAKLTGSPQGYVGYEQGGLLVERLRQHPYSVVLFDEIEHAHENVLAVLLRLLSEGMLADSDGNLADARNAIIIMTSNLLGSERANGHIGFAPEITSLSAETSQSELRTLLEQYLPGHLINRFDAILRFNPLTPDDQKTIAAQKVEELVARVTELHGIEVEINPDVFQWLANRAAEERGGARHIERVIDEYVGTVLRIALSKPGTEGAHLLLAVRPDRLKIECVLRSGNQ